MLCSYFFKIFNIQRSRQICLLLNFVLALSIFQSFKYVQEQTEISKVPLKTRLLGKSFCLVCLADIVQDGKLQGCVFCDWSSSLSKNLPFFSPPFSPPPLLQGIFVQLVQANSPASLAGLRFGDQVLQINGENCAGWSSDKAHKVLKQASAERISMIIRDR